MAVGVLEYPHPAIYVDYSYPDIFFLLLNFTVFTNKSICNTYSLGISTTNCIIAI